MLVNGMPLAKVVTPPKVDFEKEHVVFNEGVEYVVRNGLALHMDVMYPVGAKGGLPTVIWVHGGGWSAEDLTRKYLPILEIVELVKRNYTVASIDYRLSQVARFPAQIEDCKTAVRFLRANAEKYHVDTGRIAAWGESAGGHLVELMAYSNDTEFVDENFPQVSSRIQAVIPWYAPIDLREDPKATKDENHIHDRLFNYECPQEKAKMREAASPILYASRENPPTLLMHGDKDLLVNIKTSEKMYEALRAAGNDVELIKIPDQGHGFFDGEEYYKIIYDFLAKKL